MEKAIEKSVDNISNTVMIPDKEYVGEDGLLYCKVCNKNTQTKVYPFGKEKIVRCICDCGKREQEAKKERERQEELERQRRKCFAETNMAGWTFENDDRRNAKLSDAMQKYADDFESFRKDSKGLLLYGSVGTGKTYYAACIANRLIDKGYKVLMTNFVRLSNQLQGMYEGKQNFLDDLNNYALLVIDDLGVERKTEYMQEMVFNIIDSRYRAGLPLVITTNLTGEELKKPQNIMQERIYDRIYERCMPIKVDGESRRKQRLKDTNAEMKARLGL